MTKLDIIGVSGKSGSGKDFFGENVLRPSGYHRFAVAWPIKMDAVARGGFTYEEVHVTKPPAVRAWLQRRGTEDGWQKYGEDYWCVMAEAWMRTLAAEYGIRKFYLTDVRFPHEARWVRRLGGLLVRLEHDDRPYPLAGTAAAEHSSETALDDWQDWDARISNGRSATPRSLRDSLLDCLHDRLLLLLGPSAPPVVESPPECPISQLSLWPM